MAEDLETRTLDAAELRVESRGLRPVIRGYAIVYNRLSEVLGFFREQIAPEAIQSTLREGVDLRALVNHDPNVLLGRMKSGTLRVETDSHGFRVEIDPPASATGILESIGRGDVSGMSFAFRTLADKWDETVEPPIRTVTDMLVREVSVVTFPAYPQTDVALRSLVAARRPDPRGRTVLERLAWAKAQGR
jgi:Escherichia/Staphylococcus phage prohead protease